MFVQIYAIKNCLIILKYKLKQSNKQGNRSDSVLHHKKNGLKHLNYVDAVQ